MQRHRGGQLIGIVVAVVILAGCVATVHRSPESGVPAQPPLNSSPKSHAASVGPAAQSERTAAMETEVIRRVNDIRRKNGLAPLKSTETLNRVARDYSRLMATKGFFSHTGPEGKTVVDRIREAGLSFRIVAENIYTGRNVPQPAERAVEGWMDSSGHRRNILREGVTQTGVGIWRDGETHYFTQVFTRPL